MTLTVACVWVQGHVPFTAEYVRKLRSMCYRRIGRAFTFVCLTDTPLEGIECIKIDAPQNEFGWWAKWELWKRSRFTGRVLYLDLDVLAVAALDKIIDYPADFALIPDGAPNFNGKDERKTVKRYNSSVMIWNADCRPQLDGAATSDVMRRLWGDQDLIGELCPNEAMMPIEWFPRISEVRSPPWPRAARVILMKKPKNHTAALRHEWMREWWR